MTHFVDLFTALAAPFEDWEIRERKADNQSNRMLVYVTSQTVKNRLDDVLGPENWTVDFTERSGGIECRLTITLPDGSTLSRTDAGCGKDLKAAYSDAIKRAAEGFGVGRYLRKLGVPRFARTAFGEPAEIVTPPRVAAQASTPPVAPAPVGPRTGRELFDFLKSEGQHVGRNLLNEVSSFGRQHGFPTRIVDWDYAQVVDGVDEARRLAGSVQAPARRVG
jgi:hypothetical protein